MSKTQRLNREYVGHEVSRATLVPQHLAESFTDFLLEHSALLSKEQRDAVKATLYSYIMRVIEETGCEYDWDSYNTCEGSAFDLEKLFDLMDEIAPPGTAFSSHPGDGALFGFWPYCEECGEQSESRTICEYCRGAWENYNEQTPPCGACEHGQPSTEYLCEECYQVRDNNN